jgi:hypothetical protein
VEWLITDFPLFCVEDLGLLQKNGVINKTIWLTKFKVAIMQKENMLKYSTYEIHMKELKPYLQNYHIEESTIRKNHDKLNFDGTYELNIENV